ncbi:helix-turn-helix transcriptional regulator [Amycolatopsis sp. NPDC051102]|uniref:helix-turn-helix transcriptional regulator n=1 Tax=Amycolatopsis sp. NPDC051102 TaxID=3155163 RepID=UPI00342DD382
MNESRRGRPPGEGPPIRYTEARTFTGEPRWLVDEEQHPGEVAAAFAQQQLIAGIRAQHGASLSAADVADHLGKTRGDRTVIDVWSGRRAITLPMLLSLALAFDVPPLAHCDPDDLRTLFPLAHRSWLGSWRPGNGSPVFHSPTQPGGEPAWPLASRQLAEWITDEAASGTLHLTTDQVATHAAATALKAAGLPVELASLLTGPLGRLSLRYETTPEIDIQVTLSHEENGPSRSGHLMLIRRMWELRRTAAERAISVLILAHRELARLAQLIPEVDTASAGDSLRVPPRTLRDAGIPGASVNEFELTGLAREKTPVGYTVLIHDVAKPTVHQ